jgi:regulatory protein
MPRKPPPLLGAAALWEYALRRLAGRPFSVAELRAKLAARAAEPESVSGVIDRLKESGYLDDRKLAESYAARRLENQGFGRARVVRDLRKRRVAPAVAERAAEQAYRDVDEVALVEAFLARKYRAKPLPQFLAEPKNLASAYRRLRMAGFTAGTSIRVLKRYAAEAEALERLEEDGSAPDS